MGPLRWKFKTKPKSQIHLYNLGDDKTLCGRPQENYNTSDNTYSFNEYKKYWESSCKNCLKKAIEFVKKELALSNKTAMTRQSAKDYVKSKIPNARAEKQIQGRIKGTQKTYWLIRNGNETMYLASGDTEAKAWNNNQRL